MKITDEQGNVELVTFWPAGEIKKTFKEAQDTAGNPDELARLRKFYNTMKFLYEISYTSRGDVSPDEIARLYEYAKNKSVDFNGGQVA